ncbi:winged helix-turn-helix domain-containing protein [Bacillus sp. sid0103]|nr:winged helix-turn-helix domain-containing protein [Bacillus sp. sid0103]
MDDNTLTVNMTRHRKKLSKLDKPDYIGTVKGEGYVIR